MSSTDQFEKEAGFSLAEMMMGLIIFTTSVIVLGNHITVNYNGTKSQRDKVFAFAKAQALLSEIHAFVDRGGVEAAVDLDILDDGVSNRPNLTIAEDSNGALLLPDHPISSNISRGGIWQWGRRILVKPFAGQDNRNVRYVTVKIFKKDGNGIDREMASLSSVVNSIGAAFPTTQVFDVYLLAIENIPGWWVYMEAIIPFVESAITDLENRNPGLSMRTHWITKAGYGRDRAYTPDTNEELDSHVHVPDVYYYPGKMPAGSSSTYYYVPSLMKGRMRQDDELINGYDANVNPYPYAYADYYNTAMRYPQAKALYDVRKAAIEQREEDIRLAIAGGVAAPEPMTDMSKEPPLQVLLEQMNTDPDAFRHALVVNLHGELLPMPTLNNYSYAAKDPANLPNMRVVTHPEELRTARPPSSPDDVKLRVYAYSTHPDELQPLAAATIDEYVMPEDRPIVIQIMDVDLTDSTASGLIAGAQIRAITGGVPLPTPGSAVQDYGVLIDPLSGPAPSREMSYEVKFFDNSPAARSYTAILLYNTPIVHPAVTQTGAFMNGQTLGLSNDRRARNYGLEYLPSPVRGMDFTNDLATGGINVPKNTARWTITVPSTVFTSSRFVGLSGTRFNPLSTTTPDQMLTIRTRIFDPSPDDITGTITGLAWTDTGTWPAGTDTRVVQPENFSETYTWWADSPLDVPATERAQFTGDPRHNPYKDLLAGDPDFPDGYNWFYDRLSYSAEDARPNFIGLARAQIPWNSQMRQDVPRYMELLRNGIASTRSIYTTLTGYSYYYMGHGNEIGYDSANGYNDSIPTNMNSWGLGTGSTGTVDNITSRSVGGTTTGRCYVRGNRFGTGFWYALPWLGELYEDRVYASEWMVLDVFKQVRGNLTAGSTNGTYRRTADWYCGYYGRGKPWGYAHYVGKQRTQTKGCVSFMSNGTSTSHFNHHFSSGDGNLVGPGIELSNNYGFPLPSQAAITRPFSVNTSGNVPPEYNFAPYSNNRFSASIVRTFYDHPPSGFTGSGLVELENPAGTDAGYVVVNGLAETATTGTSFIAKYCLLSMFQAFFESGEQGMTYRIKQPPRVELLSPTDITELKDPATIDVNFSTDWIRWDGRKYTDDPVPSVVESESEIEYVFMYSRDGGKTWMHMQDNSPAKPGEKPSNIGLLVVDAGLGDEVFTWSTPIAAGTGNPLDDFPEGSYHIRVEAYRQNQVLHYSQHQAKIYIER